MREKLECNCENNGDLCKYCDIKDQIKEIKREMKTKGVRRVSCFNGGLTPQEYLFNSKLYELESRLA